MLADCSKVDANWKNGLIVNFFGLVLFLLSSLVTGPSFMSVSLLVLELWQFLFWRDWPEIRKSKMFLYVWVLPNIWTLERVRKTKFGTNVSSKMLLNGAKYQGYSLYHFWVIKRKPTGGRGEITPSLTQMGFK